MSVAIREKGGRLYLDMYVRGRRHWESLGLTVPPDAKGKKEVYRLAEIARLKREQQIFSGEWGLTDPVESKRPIEEYCAALAVGMNPKVHLPKVVPYLRKFSKGTPISSIDEIWLEGFRDYLLTVGALAQTSASHYFQAVCYALRKATRDRIIPRNPAERVRRIPVPEPQKVYLTVEELQTLAATPLGGDLGKEIRRAFIFACMVGLRISDIKALAWGNISRTPQPSISKRQEKTKGIVTIPLNESAWAIINDAAIHHQDELIFPRLSESKTSPTQYFRMWTKAAGIDKKIGWHSARHTFATLTLEAGSDIFTISKLLGHRGVGQTTAYAKATDPLKRHAVDALPEVSLEKKH